MEKKLVIVSALALGVLVGCQATKTEIAAKVTPVVVSPEAVNYIVKSCSALKPALDVAKSNSVPKSVSDIAVYPASYCDELVATNKLPATTDANTPSWLDKTIKLVGIAARVAGVVLPLLL